MSQSAAQAQAFYTEVVRAGTVWTIRDTGGFPAPVNADGLRAQPFWSSEARARQVIDTIPAYAGFTPEPIDLSTWRDRWLPGLERDGLLVGINWTGPRATGYDVEPRAALQRLAASSPDRTADAVPAWAHEKAVVYPHDARWAELGRVEQERLVELLRPWLVDGVEHVGSTAVPGLAAKPIIDLQASVSDPDLVVGEAAEALAADGWCYVPPALDGKPWRRFFVKPDASGQRRVAHLHLTAAGNPRWGEQIAFRDALRRDDRLARQYEELKRRLADEHGQDREVYTDAKADFVAQVLRRTSG